MASLTFDTLKSTILANARQFTVCEGYWEAMYTKDYQSLIDAGITYLVGAYKSIPQIVSDALLAEVDEALLNANGIYTTDATITDPLTEIFVLKNAVVNISLTNGERHTVNVLGTGIAHIDVSNNSWCRLKTFQNGSAIIALADTSACCVKTSGSSIVTVQLNNNSSGDITAGGDSQLTVSSNDSASALVQGFGHAQITTAGTSTIDLKLYELSKNPIII